MPAAGFSDQATAVFVVPVTVAVSCCVCEAVSEVAEGVTETVTGGLRLMVELSDFVGSAVLVAFTVTFRALAMEAGDV